MHSRASYLKEKNNSNHVAVIDRLIAVQIADELMVNTAILGTLFGAMFTYSCTEGSLG